MRLADNSSTRLAPFRGIARFAMAPRTEGIVAYVFRGLRNFFSFSEQTSSEPSSAEFCREQLLEDGGCCLDQTSDPSVTQQSSRRSGTLWECNQTEGCVSEPGLRGEDLLSRPADANCESCRILFLHGGSWYYGSPNSTGYHVLGSTLAAKTGCIVMMPDFPLLPVGEFDSMLQASVKAMQWLGNHALAQCKSDAPFKLYVAWTCRSERLFLPICRLQAGSWPESCKAVRLAVIPAGPPQHSA